MTIRFPGKKLYFESKSLRGRLRETAEKYCVKTKTKENCETQKIEKSNLKSRENRKLKFKKVRKIREKSTDFFTTLITREKFVKIQRIFFLQL